MKEYLVCVNSSYTDGVDGNINFTLKSVSEITE